MDAVFRLHNEIRPLHSPGEGIVEPAPDAQSAPLTAALGPTMYYSRCFWEAFVTIGDLLRNTIAPPEVTAALYRAAALIPGVTFVHNATDAIGRHGVAVGRIGPGVDGGVREELIFSRATLRLIGERTVIARTGVTTTATAIIARAFVDHRGQVPSAGPAPGGGRASSTPSSGPSVGRW
jgi:hypothetical protein